MSKVKKWRTWVEIDQKALRHNAEQFLKLLPKQARLMAVVKSNAYGHGLALVAKQLAESRIRNLESRTQNSKFPPEARLATGGKIQNSKLWFGVDSIVEALKLRREGIRNPVLVLGHTLPARIGEAATKNIALSVSNFDSLKKIAAAKAKPPFHLKIDTGMHRQGFLPEDLPKLIKLLKFFKLSPQGIYTHFASAKSGQGRDRVFTAGQIKKFNSVLSRLSRAGFSGFLKHAASSGGAIFYPESHFDMVRIGMGLYGYLPINSKFPACAGRQIPNSKFLSLKPVLTWKTVVGEIKEIPKGEYIGYDLTEKTKNKTKIAVLPVGYWHGYDRGLSGVGEVLIGGKRRRVLGRVSMDMVVVDVSNPPLVKVGDEVVLVGKQGKEAIRADELAQKIKTSHYEFLTRINPLIKRLVK